jgi:PKD repeat protein
MKKILIPLFLFFCFLTAWSQSKKRVLFIGNSYTNSNNLPFMFKSIAESTNDTIQYGTNTPGGYTMELHTTNSNTLNNIALANWDFVVIQEQSQRPSFPNTQVNADVFPYAKKLDSLVNVANNCTETVFYMTWGRQNGDANNCQFFTPLCTYQGMDSMLNLRYRQMADSNAALVSPVGAVWNYIRANHSLINLYSSDGSHPSPIGTYVAACTFYTTILRKDPMLIRYDYSLDSTTASIIKAAVKTVVYDSLAKWNVGKFDNKATFDFNAIHNGYQFVSQSPFMNNHSWNFGDGFTSTLENPTHSYSTGGNYTVTHQISNCGQVYIDTVNIIHLPLGLIEDQTEKLFRVSPNPSKGDINIITNNKYYRINIYSITGRLVLSELGNTNKIDINTLNSGIYFISLETEKGITPKQKIIKID